MCQKIVTRSKFKPSAQNRSPPLLPLAPFSPLQPPTHQRHVSHDMPTRHVNPPTRQPVNPSTRQPVNPSPTTCHPRHANPPTYDMSPILGPSLKENLTEADQQGGIENSDREANERLSRAAFVKQGCKVLGCRFALH